MHFNGVAYYSFVRSFVIPYLFSLFGFILHVFSLFFFLPYKSINKHSTTQLNSTQLHSAAPLAHLFIFYFHSVISCMFKNTIGEPRVHNVHNVHTCIILIRVTNIARNIRRRRKTTSKINVQRKNQTQVGEKSRVASWFLNAS